jgi:hypothetical protein
MKSIPQRFTILLLGAVLGLGSLGLLTGCGSTKTVVAPSRSTTLGQELQDLDEARQSGVISQKEYDRARKRLLEGK